MCSETSPSTTLNSDFSDSNTLTNDAASESQQRANETSDGFMAINIAEEIKTLNVLPHLC